MLFSSLNLIPSIINYFEILEFKVSGYFSIQFFTASKPRLCGILEYSDSISNDASIVSFGTEVGRMFRKSVVSLK